MPARAWLWLTVALTGGAFAAAVTLAPPASAAPGRGLAWVLFAGSSVHVAWHLAERQVCFSWTRGVTAKWEVNIFPDFVFIFGV